jgi:hypothetical protein
MKRMRTAPRRRGLLNGVLVGVIVAAAGCAGDASDRTPGDSATVVAPVDSVRAPGSAGAITRVELEAASRDVIGFLRGEVPFARIELADTVVLRVSPEGGGGRSAFAREQLNSPSQWVVQSGGQRFVLVPPAAMSEMTVTPGVHFNCMEYQLESRFPELASLPHAGVRLQPESGDSCLQSWNLTLVFDSLARPPRLTGAVYDQWEW